MIGDDRPGAGRLRQDWSRIVSTMVTRSFVRVNYARLCELRVNFKIKHEFTIHRALFIVLVHKCGDKLVYVKWS